MKRLRLSRRQAFAMILGLTDGVLTALTLATGRMLQSHSDLSLSLALRVAAASALAGGVVFLTAELAQRNYELVHAERELNLATRGYLATTRLGHFVFVESLGAAVIVSASTFAGTLAPLFVGVRFRHLTLAPICFAVALLGLLGALIAGVTYRSRARWTFGLIGAGTCLAFIGFWLHVV